MQPAHNAPGVLITFEGGEAAGKSTHIKFLASVLEQDGLDVLRLREPGGTSIGEQLRAIVLDKANNEMAPETELLIYEAARAQIVSQIIKPALARGTVVLCDRFTDSTLIYQGLGRGLSTDFIHTANLFATHGIVPDRTIVMQCSNRAESAGRMHQREDTDRLEQAGDTFHERVNAGFASLPEMYSQRVRLVETDSPHSETAQAIFAAVSDFFPWLVDQPQRYQAQLAAFDAAHHAKHA